MSNNQDKVNEDLLFALINKGGSIPVREKDHALSPEEFKEYYAKILTYQLRMPRWLIKRIDDLCKKREGMYISRHQWIMNAILNSLAGEEK